MTTKEIAEEFGKESDTYRKQMGLYCEGTQDALISREDLEKCLLKAPVAPTITNIVSLSPPKNRRTQAWLRLASDIRNHRILIPKDDELLNALANVRYTITARGKLKVLNKNEHLKLGIDLAKTDDVLAIYI